MSRATKASKKDGEKAKEPDCVCDLCDIVRAAVVNTCTAIVPVYPSITI